MLPRILKRLAPSRSDGRVVTDMTGLFENPESTSRLAGSAAEPLIGSRQAKIIQLIRQRGDITIFEAAVELGVFDHQLSGRFSELVRSGQIIQSGKRRRK